MTSPRALIRRLRAGVVPADGIERLSVGYQGVRAAVNEHLESLAAGKRPPPIFIRGEWGSGKTHMLSFIRKASGTHGLLSSKIDLNARSSPLSHPQRFYTQVMANLATTNRQGLRQILGSTLVDPTKRHAVVKFAEADQSADLRWPLINLCRMFAENENAGFGDEPAWKALLGADLGWADYAYKRRKAIARIGAMARLLRALGFGGIVLLCDEAETVDQLWNVRSRLSAYAVLGDLCHLGAVCCVFGITERFDATVRGDLQRGALDYPSAAPNAQWFLRGWRDGRFCTLHPPAIDVAGAAQLSSTVFDLYESAYPEYSPDRHALSSCIVEWARNPVRNPRRLIRMLVNSLDLAREFPHSKGIAAHA